MSGLCLRCKHRDKTASEAPCNQCYNGVKFEDGNAPEQPAKTLLDEFAMAAMGIMATAMDQGYWTPGDDPNAEIAEASYQMAKSMMKERARRDEIGNVKEVK